LKNHFFNVYVRIYDSHLFHLNKEEELDILVHTRGTCGASFNVYDQNKVKIINGVDVIHKGKDDLENEMPTQAKLNVSRISGPNNIKIKAEAISGCKSQNFLLVFNVYAKP